ncbi:MAG: glycosyl hydrolase family 79 C-terminal domain-containing protein [Solirubrobacteraceae bacterium]
MPASVARAEFGRPIAPGFVGLSFEFDAVRAYTGHDPRAINPVLEQLIRNLAPEQRPSLRIGGDSTDSTGWQTPPASSQPGASYILTSGWMQTTRALARALDARLILGIHLKDGRAGVARTEASALLAGVGRANVQAFEIGNEPELYGKFPWYRPRLGHPRPGFGQTRFGHKIYARPPGYDFQSFTADFARIGAVLGAVPLAGPATGAIPGTRLLAELLNSTPSPAVVTFHRYPLNRCFTAPTSRAYPTLSNLLAPRASSGLVDRIQPYVRLAHRRGRTFRVDELNSVACGGAHGVSDTFASSLWMLNTLFEMARIGVEGVNIHTFPGARYAPFSFGHANGRWWGSVHPAYYGLLMFARAAPPGARLLRVGHSPAAKVKIWATLGRDGAIRIVLINQSVERSHPVLIRPPVPGTGASIERLLAPSLDATSGLTLAGQHFAAPTATGTLTGSELSTPIRPVAGTYLVRLPAASAAVLTIASTAPAR